MRQPAELAPLAALALTFCSTVLSVSPVMGAAAASDPWTGVPAFPTACYSEKDGFYDALEKAKAALEDDIRKQEALNAVPTEALRQLDPMEKQRRMQAYLMKNPQEAVKYLQETQELGAAVQEAVPKDAERRQQLDDELVALRSRYDAALTAALAPMEAKIRTLPLSDGEGGSPQWAIDQRLAQLKKENAEYERLCAEWWTGSGRFPSWLKRDRDQLQGHAALEARSDAATRANFNVMGISAGAYRSTTGMSAVRQYMMHVSNVFGGRWGHARDAR